MPQQVIPITGFDQVGVIRDTPPVALPPNALSDARNVRFKDGAVRKMEGEVNIFPNLFDDAGVSYDGSILKYVVWWPNPNRIDENRGYYLVILERDISGMQMDVAYLIEPGSETLVEKGRFQRDENAAWQHTFFQGGFALIINNGLEAPQYILDSDGNNSVVAVPNFQPLPGWESYNVNEISIQDTFTATSSRVFSIGNPVNFDNFRVTAEITDNAGMTTTYTWEAAGEYTGRPSDGPSIPYSVVNGVATLTFPSDTPDVGDTVIIRVTSRMPVSVRAGVIRSFGDFLVAGNLTETSDFTNAVSGETETRVIRNLAGIVRT